MTRQRRRWTSTLASPIPEGPQGQPAHEIGAVVAVTHLMKVPNVGNISSTVPKPSALLMGPAESHMRRATELQKRIPGTLKRAEWSQPGHEVSVSDEDLLFDFFEEAMAFVLLLYAVLDAWANEQLPASVVWTNPKGETFGREAIEGRLGLELRLSRVLPEAAGQSPLTEHPKFVATFKALKRIRDSVAHVHLDETYTGYGKDPADSLFSQLLALEFEGSYREVNDLLNP